MTEFITNRISQRLKSAASGSRRPASVAVAYFGQEGAKLLPLPKRSSLVVDASEATVKSGQTCPEELKKLTKRGVRVYSHQYLHAKVFVFGSTTFIGSANVSRHSAERLIEAVVATTDRKTVKASREFVQRLCLQELGPEELDRLQEMYRPPRTLGHHRKQRASNRQRVQAGLKPVFLAQLVIGDPPEGSEPTKEAGRKLAKKHMEQPRRHVLEDFCWTGKCPFKPDVMIVQVLNEGAGRWMVSPAANVISTKKWNGKNPCTFVYLELPRRRRVTVERLAKRIGRGAKKRLSRGGKVNRDFAERLLAAWKD